MAGRVAENSKVTANKIKRRDWSTDAYQFKSILVSISGRSIIRDAMKLFTVNGALDLRTGYTDIGKHMIIHCTKFTQCTATGNILIEFLTNVHFFSPLWMRLI